MAALLALFSFHRLQCLILYLALFHLPLVMDLVGSGPRWTNAYFEPFLSCELYSKLNWPLFSWQNLTVNLLLVVWTVVIIVRQRRTPWNISCRSWTKNGLPK